MFLPKDGTANYADDNNPWSTGNGIHNIISDLEQASDILSIWFIDNYLKANPRKYLVLLRETPETQLIVENVSPHIQWSATSIEPKTGFIP